MTAKQKMTPAYAVIFSLSIAMIFLVMAVGIANGSKAVGFSAWVWGYTAWQMHKRNNSALAAFWKIMVWAVVLSMVIGLIAFFRTGDGVERIVGDDFVYFCVKAIIVLVLSYALMRFFKTHRDLTAIQFPVEKNKSIDDKFWGMALDEFESSKDTSVWAKVFAEADGDADKAKASYLKVRAKALQLVDGDDAKSAGFENNISRAENSPASANILVENKKVEGDKRFWFVGFGVFVVAIIGYSLYGGDASKPVKVSYADSKKLYDLYSRKNYKDCNSPYNEKPDVTWEFVYKKDSNDIFAKIEYEDDGGVRKKDVIKLESCTIMDENNWSCGGEWTGAYQAPKYSFVNGEFSYNKGVSVLKGDANCTPKIVKR